MRELPWGRPLEEGNGEDKKPLEELPAMRISNHRTTPPDEKPKRVATMRPLSFVLCPLSAGFFLRFLEL